MAATFYSVSLAHHLFLQTMCAELAWHEVMHFSCVAAIFVGVGSGCIKNSNTVAFPTSVMGAR